MTRYNGNMNGMEAWKKYSTMKKLKEFSSIGRAECGMG